MSDRTDAADMLDAAADWLLTHGWRQNEYGGSDGPNCLVGALTYANQVSGWARALGQDLWESVPTSSGPRKIAMDALLETTGAEFLILFDEYNFTAWNDAAGRTEDEVHDALRNAAKALREDV